MKVIVICEIPDDTGVKDWLQHVRDFDVSHPGCRFQILVDAPGKRVEEIGEMLEVGPPLMLKKMVRVGDG